MGLTVLYFAVEIRKRGFQWKVFVSTLAGLQGKWLALACVFVLTTYYGRALRWAILLKPLKERPRMWNLFSATVIGFAAITVLGRPGEFVRPYLIAVKERVPVSSQLAAWFLERIYDLLVALFVFGFALSRVDASAANVGPGLAWVLAMGGRIVGVLCLISISVLMAFRLFSEKMQRRLLDALEFLPRHHFDRAEKLVRAFVQGVESTRSHWSMLLLIAYTVLEWFLIAACYICITKAFGDVLHFSLIDIFIFMGFVSFGTVVQIPGVGGGTQVVAILILTELFNIPLEVATSVALLVWIISSVVVMPLGIVLAFKEGLNWHKLKHLQEEVGQ